MKSNGYQFWFEADGGKTKLQLPVNPETLNELLITAALRLRGLERLLF